MTEPYFVPDEFITIPPRGHLERALYVKHIDIRGRLVQPPIRYDKVEGGNLMLEYLMSAHGPQVVDRLMTVTFKQGRARGVFSDDASQEILKRGIVFSGVMYRFLGHSNSQLKEKTCFLMNASDEDIYEVLALFGNFSKIKTAAKRAKRIGLLFSTFGRSISLEEHEYEVIDDVERGKYIFTDGCGLMSDAFAQQIQDARGLDAKSSVVQVRYQGFKGVLLLSRQLGDQDQVKVQFRKSMKKFAIPDERMRQTCNTFGVVKCSGPYTVGYLNKQITMLLADSGVNHGHLTGLQNDFHAMLRELCGTAQSTEYYLRIKGERKLLEWLHNYGLESHRLQKELKALRSKEVRKMQKDRMADDGGVDNDDDDTSPPETSKCKLRVLVPKSRVVFGVCDPLNELHYGECVFQPTLFDEVQLAEFQTAPEVMVVRNPCYFAGDIRVLRLVKDRPQYAHLSDCIVFPTRGARPHADESSGGDLDGDEFFVSWDEDLIPRWRSAPFDYSYTSPLLVIPNAIKKYFEQAASSVRHHVTAWGHKSFPSLFGTPEQAEKARKEKERRHMLEYFTSFNNDLVGRVDAIFMKYAALYGPSCHECVYLNRFFSDAVDMVAEKEDVVTKLRELEREYKRIEQNPPDRHSLDAFGRFLGWIADQKPPFRPGDDVWTRMEEKTRLFVEEMSGRN